MLIVVSRDTVAEMSAARSACDAENAFGQRREGSMAKSSFWGLAHVDLTLRRLLPISNLVQLCELHLAPAPIVK